MHPNSHSNNARPSRPTNAAYNNQQQSQQHNVNRMPAPSTAPPRPAQMIGQPQPQYFVMQPGPGGYYQIPTGVYYAPGAPQLTAQQMAFMQAQQQQQQGQQNRLPIQHGQGQIPATVQPPRNQTSNQSTPNLQPMYNPYQMHYQQGAAMYPQQQVQPRPKPDVPKPAKKILSIVDPRTKQEIKITPSGPKVPEKEQSKPEPVVEEKPIPAPEVEEVKEDSKADDAGKLFYQQALQKVQAGGDSEVKPTSELVKTEPVKAVEAAPTKVSASVVETKTEKPKENEPKETKQEEITQEETNNVGIKLQMKIIGGKKTYEIRELEKLKSECTEIPEEITALNMTLIQAPGAAVLRPKGSAFAGKSKFGNHRQNAGGPNQGGPKWNKGGSNKHVVSTSIAVNVQLHRAKNAWKPQKAENAHEEILMEANSILNKMSKERFDSLSRKMAELEMPSLFTWKSVIKAIREKALAEAKFSDTYADLCRVMNERIARKAKHKHELYKHFKFISIIEQDGEFFWTTGAEILPKENKNEEYAAGDLQPQKGPFKTAVEAENDASKVVDFKRSILALCQTDFQKENRYDEVNKGEQDTSKAMAALKQDKAMDSTKKAEEEKKLFEKLSGLKYEGKMIKKRLLGNMTFIGELYKKDMISLKVISFCLSTLAKLPSEKDTEPAKNPEAEDVECLCHMLTAMGKTLEKSSNDATSKAFVSTLFDRVKQLSKSDNLDARHRFMCLDLLELRQSGWKKLKAGKLEAKTIKEIHEDVKREEEEKEMKLRELRASQGGNFSKHQNRWGNKSRGNPPPPTHSFSSGKATSSITSANMGARPRGAGLFSASNRPTILSQAPLLLEKEERDQLKKKATNTVKEFAHNKDEGELVSYIQEIHAKVPALKRGKTKLISEVFVGQFIYQFLDGKDADREVIPTMFQVLTKKQIFDSSNLTSELKKVQEYLSDLIVDAPKAGTHFGTLLSKLVSSKLITLSDVKKVTSGISKENNFAANKVVDSMFESFATDEFVPQQEKASFL